MYMRGLKNRKLLVRRIDLYRNGLINFLVSIPVISLLLEHIASHTPQLIRSKLNCNTGTVRIKFCFDRFILTGKRQSCFKGITVKRHLACVHNEFTIAFLYYVAVKCNICFQRFIRKSSQRHGSHHRNDQQPGNQTNQAFLHFLFPPLVFSHVQKIRL